MLDYASSCLCEVNLVKGTFEMNIVLWILQVLLALLFLFAGGTKLVLSTETLTQMGSPNQIVMPVWFIRFIGVVEVLGALGLILPGVFKTRQNLTTLAAVGLAIVMVGAVVLTIMGDGVFMAITPFVTLLLLLFVTYGRPRVRPLG
jgi:uncharacterized membrane protein YphA (DoxX/SURF4 family)